MCERENKIVPEGIAEMEAEFSDWQAENGHLLDNGLSGDVADLRLRLNAAWIKARPLLGWNREKKKWVPWVPAD
jgi:hypothetical protein